MVRCSVIFLVLLSFSSFLATYNTVNMLLSKHHATSGDEETEPVQKVTKNDLPSENVKLSSVIGVVKRPIDSNQVRKKRMFHTVVTASAGPYSKWQCRVMYFWYKKYAAMEGSEMGGFTRVLHSGVEDNLMEEIPTWIAQPLPEGMDKGYVVLNRPWAFVQWVQQAKIEEEYVLMAEPDHIFVKPLPNLATEFMPAAFPFFYITPKEFEAILRRWVPDGPITDIDPIGNSPVIIKKSELLKIAPTWHNVSLEMKGDDRVDKAFGWVLEMYAYATAARMNGVQHILRKDFMIQPPWDVVIGDAFIIHYTYGCDYTLKGEHMPGKFGEWRFDKRTWSGGAPPRNLTLPPKGVPEPVVRLISAINDATFSLKDWQEGAQ